MRAWGRALQRLRDHGHLLALAAMLLIVPLFPGAVPGGIYGLGLVSGAALAMQAAAIVLIYRSNRIINFAQVPLGAAAGALFVSLTQLGPLVRLVEGVCPGCVEGAWLGNVIYVVAIVAGLGFAALCGWAIHFFVVRRFASSTPLVLTVATIFIAQLLVGIKELLPRLLASEEQRRAGVELQAAPPPFDFTLIWDPVRFHAPAILTVLVALAAGIGIWLLLHRTGIGVAIRSSAEDPERAATLGVNVSAVTGRVWLIAALLAGTAGIVGAMSSAPVGTEPLSVSATVRILGVAVIAGMESLPVAVGAALVFGILDQAVLWSFGSLLVLDGALIVIVGTVLLIRRYRPQRAGAEIAAGWRATREARPVPSELARLPEVRRWGRLVRAGVVVALFGYPWIMSPSQTALASAVMVYAMVGLSILVLTGWAGQISLGQFALAAVGGYVVAVLPLPALASLPVAALAGAAAAVLVGVPALRIRGLNLAITTLAFALTTTTLLLNPEFLGRWLPDTLDRPTLAGMDLDDERSFYYFTLFFLALVVAAVAGMRRSQTGRALIAARDNEAAAQAFGVGLTRARLEAFAVSGFIAALAGGLFAFNQHGVRAAAFAPETSVDLFLMTVIGGLGAITSPLLGALYRGVIDLAGTAPAVAFVATGGGGLFLLLVVPGGLGQLVQDLRDAWLRRFALRHRIAVPSLLGAVGTGERAAIEPKRRPTGGLVFVPKRYRIEEQWAMEGRSERSKGERAGG